MQKKSLAFTLIELMVVVAIIWLAAAILVPAFLKARDRAQQRQTLPQSPAASATAEEPAAPEPGQLPSEVSFRGQGQLCSWTTRFGMDVTSRYRLRFHATFAVRGGKVLFVPFPRDCQEASNIRVRVNNVEFSDWMLARPGLTIPLGQTPAQVEVDYEAQGRDALILELPPARRLGEVAWALDHSDASQARLAPASLQPTGSEPGQSWRWDFRGLYSQAPILVELPASHSLTSKVLQLCRLAGTAVLLFGLGVWYLGELHRPGCLARFGWGHFLMLALTYSFFFPVFSVLSLNRGASLLPALAVSLSLSLPLLVLHVWRSLDLRFAVVYTLPLSVLTLAAVVNGVFGESWRELIWIGLAFITVAFVTLTFPRWREHRRLWQQGLEQDLQARIRLLGQPARELENEVLAWSGKNADSTLREALGRSQRLVNEWREADHQALKLGQGSDYQVLLWRAQGLERELPHALAQLRRVVSRRHQEGGRAHCLHCGCVTPDGSAFCPQCGARSAALLQCQCGTRTWLPRPLPQPCHCPGCGQEVGSEIG